MEPEWFDNPHHLYCQQIVMILAGISTIPLLTICYMILKISKIQHTYNLAFYLKMILLLLINLLFSLKASEKYGLILK